MMAYAFERFLPAAKSWRELFDLVIVQAGKPSFFDARASLFEVVDEQGLLRPHVGKLVQGGAYLGGNARVIEAHLGLSGDEILYVGDHVYADIHVSSQALRWRTALVLRELEHEIEATDRFAGSQRELDALMAQKAACEQEHARARLSLQRASAAGQKPQRGAAERIRTLRDQMVELDQRIGPLAQQASQLGNARWGPLMHAGNDKSRLARQIERYADLYTSRVSNLLHLTPYGYLRAPRGSLPHDL
jgi:hypothetical protein